MSRASEILENSSDSYNPELRTEIIRTHRNNLTKISSDFEKSKNDKKLSATDRKLFASLEVDIDEMRKKLFEIQ